MSIPFRFECTLGDSRARYSCHCLCPSSLQVCVCICSHLYMTVYTYIRICIDTYANLPSFSHTNYIIRTTSAVRRRKEKETRKKERKKEAKRAGLPRRLPLVIWPFRKHKPSHLFPYIHTYTIHNYNRIYFVHVPLVHFAILADASFASPT